MPDFWIAVFMGIGLTVIVVLYAIKRAIRDAKKKKQGEQNGKAKS